IMSSMPQVAWERPCDASRRPNGAAAEEPIESADTAHAGLEALCLVARLHHVAASPAELLHTLGKGPSETIGTEDLLLCAERLQLKARLTRTGVDRLRHTPLPALALMRDGSISVLAQCDEQRVLLQSFSNTGNAGASRPLIEP